MKESTVLAGFLKDLRGLSSDLVVLKHADLSMIGMVDFSVTKWGMTQFWEAKLVLPGRDMDRFGNWSPLAIASASPRQFELAKRLRAWYIFFVVPHGAKRKRVGEWVLWHPMIHVTYTFHVKSTCLEAMLP